MPVVILISIRVTIMPLCLAISSVTPAPEVSETDCVFTNHPLMMETEIVSEYFAIQVRTVAVACLIGCVHISGYRSLTAYRPAFSVPATEHAEQQFEVRVFRRLQHPDHNIGTTRNVNKDGQ